MDMITIGDVKLDTFVVLDEASAQCELKMPDSKLCLDYGGKISVNVVDSQMAGSAPNVAVGLARMGYKTAVISNMGADGTRALTLSRFKDEGVSSKYIRVVKDQPSAYSVVINYKGDRTILASQTQKAYRLPKIGRTKWLYVSEMGPGYELLYREVTAYVKRTGALLGFNPGTIQIREKKKFLFDLIKHTAVLFVNVEEAQALVETSEREIHHLAAALWKFGPGHVVITDGKNGAYGFDGKNLTHCPIIPAKPVDPTGAGDAFATGFIGARMAGVDAEDALRYGVTNSASVVGHVGPQPGLLSLTQIRSRLKKHTSIKPVHI